jgi:acetyl-CoA acetyltransferase
METYVLGLAVSPPHAALRSQRTEELAFQTVRAALARARVGRGEVDAVTLATSDEMDGRSISSMLMAAPSGSYLKDELRVTDSGLTGLMLGALRIASGRFHLGLVVSWSHTSQIDVDALMRMRAEPFALRPVGMNSVIADGLVAGDVQRRLGLDETAVAVRVAARQQQAQRNSRALPQAMQSVAGINATPLSAWPLRHGHRAPATDGCVAFVLCSRDWLARHPQHRPMARLAAVTSGIDRYRLDGERLGAMTQFDRTLTDVLQRAGQADGARIDVLEIEAPTGWHDLALEHHLAPRNVGAISPSGGVWAQNPLFCSGLVNAAEAVLQVAGEAGAVQVDGARFALAHGCHGYAQQAHTFAAFERMAA